MEKLKAKYLGETDAFGLENGVIYDVISVELGVADTKWFRIVLEDDDDDGSGTPGYLYPEWAFEIISLDEDEKKYFPEMD